MKTAEHLLTCLSEEGSEIVQDCCKALRFGLDDRNVLNPTGPTNRERLVSELNDLMGVITLCVLADIIPSNWRNETAIQAKQEKVRKFMAYAESVGTLEQQASALEKEGNV